MSTTSSRLGSVLVAVMLFSSVAGAQQTKQAGKAAKSKEKGEKALTWGAAPDAFPAGARMAVERGNPMKNGEFVVRLAFPAGYRIPAHFHPTAEHVTVRSGTFLVGMGDAIDESKTMKMAAGDTGTIAPKMHHFAIAQDSVTLSIRAKGPFAMTYVNAADDPRKKK